MTDHNLLATHRPNTDYCELGFSLGGHMQRDTLLYNKVMIANRENVESGVHDQDRAGRGHMKDKHETSGRQM